MNILIFHGFDSSPDSLHETVRCLTKDGHQVVTPSMSSFSLCNGKHRSSKDWLDEAEAVFYDFSMTTAGDLCVVGHSLGGAICAHLLGQSSCRRDFSNRIVKSAFLASPAGIDDGFLAYWRNTSSDRIDWPFSLQVQMFSFLRSTDSVYGSISVPSCVLQGGSDLHIPPSSGAVLAEKLGANCQCLHTHPEADHFFPNSSSAGATYLQEKLAAFLTSDDLTP